MPQQATADLVAARDRRDARAGLLDLGQDPELLLHAPAAPTLHARDDLHADLVLNAASKSERRVGPQHATEKAAVTGWILSIASAAAPTIAAAILAVASWRWLFAVNVPIGLAVVAIGRLALPSNERAARAFDWRSTLLNAVLFAALFMTANALVAGRIGAATIACGVVAVVSGAAPLQVARGQAHPLVPTDLLRAPRLRTSYGASISAFAG